MIRQFNLTIERSVKLDSLGWPEPGAAAADGLRCNRAYCDLRGYSWRQSMEILQLEERLTTRFQSKEDSRTVLGAVSRELDELHDNGEDGLLGLDLGVASTVIALSAARCIPFSSCNGGAFGDHHEEAHPLVSFFVKPAWVAILLNIAKEADVGLYNSGDALVVYGEILDMLSFARGLSANRRLFSKLKLRDDDSSKAHQNQHDLPFSS
jgi:hypothetical protein